MEPMDLSGSCEQPQGLQEFLDKPCSSEGQTGCKTEVPNNLNAGHEMGGHFSKVDKSSTTGQSATDDSNINVQHHDMDQEIRHLKNEAQVAEELIRSQNETIQKLQESWNNCQDEIKMLKKEKFDLRSIILSSNGPEQVSDDEMKSLFTAIRQKIQAITHSKALDLGQNVPLLSTRSAAWYQFYEHWNHLSLTERSLKVRGKIFGIVSDQILAKNLFGILPVENSDLKHIEFTLRKLEDVMMENQVPSGTITDWRVTTMKAIDEIKIQHAPPCFAANDIWKLFRCLSLKKAASAATQKFESDIVQLCNDAYYLRTLMRKSKDKYSCELFRPGTNIQEVGTALEVCGVERGGQASDIVAFVVSGALVKQPQDVNEPAIVLEPAHVVVRQV